jgi:hypothetical protein
MYNPRHARPKKQRRVSLLGIDGALDSKAQTGLLLLQVLMLLTAFGVGFVIVVMGT